MLRSNSIVISYEHLASLRLLAKIDNLGSAEAALEKIVSGYMATRPEIGDFLARRAAGRKASDAASEKEWKAAWPNLAINDELP